jgi:hypothetical protein
MPFQAQVNVQPAPGVAGDFASSNPRAVALAGPSGLVAGNNGVTVGKFAWVPLATPTIANNYGSSTSGAPTGFVHRAQQGLITAFLGEQSMVVPVGLPVVLHSAGDFWVVNNGTSSANIGDPVYASYADGSIANSVQAGAAFTGSIGGTFTGAIGASFTATGTGTSFVTSAQTGYLSIGDVITGTGVPTGTTVIAQTAGTTGAAGTYTTSAVTTASGASCTTTSKVLQITAVSTGTLRTTDVISGGTIVPNTTITGQTLGTVGGIGLYSLSGASQASASGTVTSLSTVLTVSALTSGTLYVGDPISGASVTSGSVITGLLTGAGGLGTYTLNNVSTVAAESMTTTGGVLTKWKIMSAGAVGELVKISSWLLG